MIRIEKDDAPPQLSVYTRCSVGLNGSKVTRAHKEWWLATVFFNDPRHYANDEKLVKATFPFSVYKDADLVRALGKIFDGKCAYCESRFAAVTPQDIEHFRPKSEVENRSQPALRPGYYWLAGDWSNLLVSCIDCNRARKHIVPGQPDQVLLGKDTQFPLSDEAKRVRHHSGDVMAEEPYRLLLQPCIDRPEEHLTYGDDALIYPRNPGDQKAIQSIFVYALQRKGLVEERKRVLNDLQLKLALLVLLAAEIHSITDATHPHSREIKRAQIELAMKSICDMFRRGAPYLGMLRDYLRRSLDGGALVNVATVGIDLNQLLQ